MPGNVITIGLDTQTVFYQPHCFYTGQNIQVLINKNINLLTSFFLLPILKIQMDKFSWGGNGATLGRLNRTKAMLPVTKSNKVCLLYTSPSPRDLSTSRMPSSA